MSFERARRPFPPIGKADPFGKLALSVSQRQWFLPDSTLGYQHELQKAQKHWLIHGPLNEDQVLLCLGRLIDRHEILRTTYHASAGKRWQVVADRAPPCVIYQNLSALPTGHQTAAVDAVLQEQFDKLVDFAMGPVIYAALIKLSVERHVLALNIMHIAMDNRSMKIIAGEFFADLFACTANATMADRNPLDKQYSDYVAWQQSWLTETGLAENRDTWLRDLAGRPPVQVVRSCRAPNSLGHRPGFAQYLIGGDLRAAIAQRARTNAATVAMVLEFAIIRMLSRVSGQAEFYCSLVSDMRPAAFNDVVGCFATSAPLIADDVAEQPPDMGLRRLRGRHIAAVDWRNQCDPIEIPHLARVSINITNASRRLTEVQSAQPAEVDRASRASPSIRVEKWRPGGSSFTRVSSHLAVYARDDGIQIPVQIIYAADVLGEDEISRFIEGTMEELRLLALSD